MKNTILPKQHYTTIGNYSPLYVASKNGKSKRDFIFQMYYQVHPTVQSVRSWDEQWFGNYE